MRKTFIVCTAAAAIFTVSAIASLRAEAMTISSPAGLSAAIHGPNLALDVVYDGYYPPYGYYRYVCRAWWKGCGWEPGHYWNYWPNRYYYRPYGYYRPDRRYRHW